MDHQSVQRMAARAMSTILTAHHVQHAYIGGFAVATLGHTRSTEDIDVEVKMNDGESLSRESIIRHLVEADSRFSTQGSKLFFTSIESPEFPVPVETLAAGMLGLPPTFDAIHIGEDQIPILRPSVLVLTKIKRCVHFFGSTRPKSLRKMGSDISDINFLLLYLAKRSENIDFVKYSSPHPERLYEATKSLLKWYRSNERDDMAVVLLSVLTNDDLGKVDVL